MANPQLENGFTMIANEILEALMRIQLAPNQWQVLLCIIRRTYGYKKKVDRIANSQIMQYTGLGKEVVSRAFLHLRQKGLIQRNGKTVSFVKDYEQWKLAELPTKVSSSPVTQNKKHILQKKDGEISNTNIVLTPSGSIIDENNTIIHYQSLRKIRQILNGKIEATEANKRLYRRELRKLGIPEPI